MSRDSRPNASSKGVVEAEVFDGTMALAQTEVVVLCCFCCGCKVS